MKQIEIQVVRRTKQIRSYNVKCGDSEPPEKAIQRALKDAKERGWSDVEEAVIVEGHYIPALEEWEKQLSNNSENQITWL